MRTMTSLLGRRGATPLGLLLAMTLFGSMTLANSAEALSCRQRLVSAGTSSARVIELCGDPTEIVQRTETRSRTIQRVAPDGTVIQDTVSYTVVVETWTYDFGPQRFMRQLIFEDGTLRQIRTLGYGTAGHTPR